MNTIALVGDSVLDNFFWLEHKNMDLKYVLTKFGYQVDNFAVDESTLKDVVEGIIPREIYSKSRAYSYDLSEDGKVHPLDLLESFRSNLTVLSVGGNDLRVNISSVIYGLSNFVNSVFNKDFEEKYCKAVEKIRKFSDRIVLVCVYSPYMGEGSPYSFLSNFKDQIYNDIRNFYYKIGMKYDIPVIDLSKTFDSSNRSHYGSTVIEPSDLSNFCIASIIHHVYKKSNGYGVYYCENCSQTITVEKPNVLDCKNY